MLKGGKIAVKNLNTLLNESYKNKDKTEKNINNHYELDEDLSTDKTKVYRDLDNNDIKMVNRGTYDKRDVLTDAKLIFGYKDKSRFNEAREILNKVKNKYPDKSIDMIGHSLGAAVAEDLGNDPQVKNVITLNKPTTPYDLIKKSKVNDRQYDIRTTKDIVSMLQPLQKDKNDIVIPSESNNLYTEHKIDVLDRLDQDRIIGEGLKTKKLKQLSNYDLYNLVEKMHLPLNDIIMKDEGENITKIGFYIINLDNSKGPGTHWTSLYYHPIQSIYFDSFGFMAPLEIEEAIRPYIYNDNDIQDFDSSACGYYVIAFIKFLHNKNDKYEAYKQFLRLFKNKTIENDNILYKYLYG